MSVQTEEVYSNLNKLLYDICKFLTDDTKLSPFGRKQADELIKRSKEQLTMIAKITLDLNKECDGAYVDMERKPVENDVECNIIYSSVEESNVLPSPVITQINPFVNFPAKNLCRAVKYGDLSWKCKILLTFEKMRRIYAGVYENFFLIYTSEKDAKPLQCIDLKFYQAEAVCAKNNKNPPQDFQLINIAQGKLYYFAAKNNKDMLQWISHINKCHESTTKPCEAAEEEEEEQIYHDIEPYRATDEDLSDKNKPPDLPERHGVKTYMPLPPIPNLQETESASQPSLESESSFSDDDEDHIYEPFVAKASQSEDNEEVYENSDTVKPKSYFKPIQSEDIEEVYENGNTNAAFAKPQFPVVTDEPEEVYENSTTNTAFGKPHLPVFTDEPEEVYENSHNGFTKVEDEIYENNDKEEIEEIYENSNAKHFEKPKPVIAIKPKILKEKPKFLSSFRK